jgi:gluconokinase
VTTAPPPPAEVIIGLDVGTTGTKAVSFGLGSSWRHTVVREYPLLQPAPREQVQDPATVVAALMGALAECVQRSRGATVTAISVSTAMHGLLGLDNDLRPVTPLVTWADGRAADEARALRESGQAEELQRRSGTPVHPMSPLTKLMWFARHEPVLSSRVRAWVGLKDLVVHALTDTLVTELSSASGTGLLDMTSRTWSPAACDLAGVREHQLPPVLATTAVLGLSASAAARLGLASGIPVVVGAGDGPLANLGTGALATGTAGLSLGTSGAVRMVVPEPVIDRSARLFCYALTDDAWVVGGAISNGGIVARWAGDVFGAGTARSNAAPSDGELLSLAAAVPPGSDGLVMLPYLLPERAPLWDPDLTGAFLGVRHGHTRGHFVRAAVEGVALQLSAVVDELATLAPVTAVRATGGAFRASLWRSVVASAIGRPLSVPARAEGSALGAAALGLLATGRAPSLAHAVEALTPGLLDGPDEHVRVSVADAAAYEAVRRAVPQLLASYEDVARLFDRPQPVPATVSESLLHR